MSRDRASHRTVLVTGGAGFIGSNLTARLLRDGVRVIVLDDLSRPGVEHNARWLKDLGRDRVEVVVADVRDRTAVRAAVDHADTVFHFAAQVAVTTSLADRWHDFEVNLRGTLEVLEAAYSRVERPAVLFTSTNKVYGALSDVALRDDGVRYAPVDEAVRTRGIDEDRPLDFHGPYGCSKGGADAYVRDYARTLGLRTCVFRMSCIYGPRQRGTEDQGWVAHFLRRALRGAPITLYGDGLQVRDVLYVDDLVEAFLAAWRHLDADPAFAGRAFNVGGGPENAVSLRDVLRHIAELHGVPPAVRLEGWRPGDQRYYVSDVRRFTEATGWRPRTPVAEGLRALHAWLREVADERPDAAELPAARFTTAHAE